MAGPHLKGGTWGVNSKGKRFQVSKGLLSQVKGNPQTDDALQNAIQDVREKNNKAESERLKQRTRDRVEAAKPKPVDGYEIKEARYAKNKMAIHVNHAQGGFFASNNDQAKLAEALGGRYSHREQSYIISKKRAELFTALVEAGYRGTLFSNKIVHKEDSVVNPRELSPKDFKIVNGKLTVSSPKPKTGGKPKTQTVNGEIIPTIKIAKTTKKFEPLVKELQSTKVGQGGDYPQIALTRKSYKVVVTKTPANYEVSINNEGIGQQRLDRVPHKEFEQNYRWYI